MIAGLSLHASAPVSDRQPIDLIYRHAVEVPRNGVLERARSHRKPQRVVRRSPRHQPIDQPRRKTVAPADPIDQANLVTPGCGPALPYAPSQSTALHPLSLAERLSRKRDGHASDAKKSRATCRAAPSNARTSSSPAVTSLSVPRWRGPIAGPPRWQSPGRHCAPAGSSPLARAPPSTAYAGSSGRR